MKQEEIITAFEDTEAIIHGHHVLAGLKHSEDYFDKRKVTADAELTSRVCFEFAWRFKDADIDLVLGPASGAIPMIIETVKHLNFLNLLRKKKALGIYADKEKTGGKNKFVFKGGFAEMIRGKRVLVIEDVTTSGRSVRDVVDLVKAYGGIVVAVCVLWNRKNVTAADVGAPELYCLVIKEIASWPADKCHLCDEGVPVNENTGRGKDFMEQQRAIKNAEKS